jgi:hypothetical protein
VHRLPPVSRSSFPRAQNKRPRGSTTRRVTVAPRCSCPRADAVCVLSWCLRLFPQIGAMAPSSSGTSPERSYTLVLELRGAEPAVPPSRGAVRIVGVGAPFPPGYHHARAEKATAPCVISPTLFLTTLTFTSQPPRAVKCALRCSRCKSNVLQDVLYARPCLVSKFF